MDEEVPVHEGGDGSRLLTGSLLRRAPMRCLGTRPPTSSARDAQGRYACVAGHPEGGRVGLRRSWQHASEIGGANPLLAEDEWTVSSRGRIAMVSESNYHVDWAVPNGQNTSGVASGFTSI